MSTWEERLERELDRAADRLIAGRAPRRAARRPLVLAFVGAAAAAVLVVAVLVAGGGGPRPEDPAPQPAAPPATSSEADRMATRYVSCRGGDTGTQIARSAMAPADACAAQPGAPAGPWVACAENDASSIEVRHTTASCAERGKDPPPDGFVEGARRVLALEATIRAIEGATACIAPDALGVEIQAVLDRTGWADWTAVVRDDLSRGPCGHALSLGGDGSRAQLSLLPRDRQVMIAGEPRG